MKFTLCILLIILTTYSPELKAQNQTFFEAYEDKDYDTVRQLAIKIDVNVPDSASPYLITPLYVAADLNDLEMVKMFIKNGANTNTKGPLGWTPLHLAVKNNNIEMVKILVANRADVNEPDEDGWTALHAACRWQDNLHLVKILIENGADINNEGISVSYSDIYNKENDSDEYREKTIDTLGTPLNLASAYGHWNIAEYLMEKGAQFSSADCNNFLHDAARLGNSEFFHFFIGKGADINSLNLYGESMLHSACIGGNIDIANFLISQGQDVNSKHELGTPLHNATRYGYIEIVRMLIEQGANFYEDDFYGNTPLHKTSNENMVQFFIDKGMDVNKKNNNGKTPLHFACVSSKLNIVNKLIKNNADVNVKDNEGNTPLNEMFKYTDYKIKVFANQGATEDLLGYDIPGNNPDFSIIQLLSKKGANLHTINKSGLTLLHKSIRCISCNKNRNEQGIEFIRILLKNKLDINAKDKKNKTPLHIAAFIGNIDIIKILIDNKAKINIQDKDGNTPLHVANYYSHKEVYQYLIENGASLEIKNKLGQVPAECNKRFKMHPLTEPPPHLIDLIR